MKSLLQTTLILVILAGAIPLLAQPGNDNCGSAIDITADINSGSCTGYTTVSATDDLEGSCNNNLCSGGPGNNPNENVWFSFTAPAYGDVRFTVDGYAWGTPNYDPIITIFDACNAGNELGCSNAGGDGVNNDSVKTVTFTALDSNVTYYFSVDAPCAYQGAFCLEIEYLDPAHCTNGIMDSDETGVDCGGISCIACHCLNSVQDADETGVDCGGADCGACMSCTDNGDCGSATPLTFSGGPDTLTACVTDCNTGASAESWNFTGGTCPDVTNTETVYYTFTTTEFYLDIDVTSSDITQPQLVLLTNDCASFYQSGCEVGMGGAVSITGFPAGAGSTYNLMVTSQSGDNGTFNLCITNYADLSACAVDDTLTASPPPDTSGGNFQGGYPPGTTVTFCYDLNQYNKVGCQWLQGIVPIIGSGWDTSTFNVTVAPVSADGSGTWNWFSAATGTVVTYNFNGTFYSTGDTVNPNGGWFYLQNCGPCPNHGGDPNLSWGDGNCGGPCQCDATGSGYTWQVCFELTTPLICVPGADLSVGIKTFADGEIGGYATPGCDVDGIEYPAIPSPTSICASCGILSIAATDVLCAGDSTGTATTTMDASGTAPYTYAWNTSPVQTDSVAAELPAGAYQVNVTDSLGCTDSGIVTITEPSALAVQITDSTMILCFGDSTGSATASAAGGVTPYSYLWSDAGAQTDSTATGLAAGTYQVIVTDSNGCSDSAELLITQPALALTAGIGASTDLICNGVPTGDITATVVGGTAAYTYQWNDPGAQTTATATGLQAGLYQILIIDANGCSDSDTISLTQPPALTLAITAQTDANCSASDGNATATPGGGTGTYTYQWNDPGAQTDSAATGLAAGSYKVVVTDGNGCQDSISVNINNQGGGSASITDSVHILCNGDSTGMATVTPAGGTMPFTYSWNSVPVQTDSVLDGVPAGAYTVTVTDSVNCISLVTFTINEPMALVLTPVSITHVACNGDSSGSSEISASGGMAPYSYQWDDPSAQTLAIASGLPAGSYTAVVSDANGCSDSIPSTITEPPALSLVISDSIMVGCNGDSTGSATVTPSGGVSPYTYLWNDPFLQTDSVAAGIPSGLFTSVVTDANGCMDSITVTITQPQLLLLSTTADSTSCNGYADGQATVVVSGGTANFSYIWSNGDSTMNTVDTIDSSTSLITGTYSVTVTDNNGCTATDSAVVGQPLDVTVSIVQDSSIACNGDSSAVVTAVLNFGAAPFNYEWSSGDTLLATTDTFNTVTGLEAGTYTVQVSDVSGCINSDSIVISQPSLLDPGSSVDNHASCNGFSDGSATVSTKSTGTSPWSYVWSNGDSTMNTSSSTNSTSGLSAGTYFVTITDANGCADVDTVVILEPAALSLTTTTMDASCGASDGYATVSVTGGVGAYTYAWNDPSLQTSDSAVALAAGAYTVVVSDSNGCTDFSGVTINNLSGAGIVIDSVVNVSCNGNSDGAIGISAAGGAAPLTYLWSNSATTEDVTGLGAGTYFVSVTDSNGCVSTDSAVISEPAALTLATATADADCGAANGSASVSAGGGTGSYTYLWNDAAMQTSDTAILLGAGMYSVLVTDSNGCTVGANVTISNTGGYIIMIDSVVDPGCNGDSTGSIYITVTGGGLPLTYTWSNGNVTDDISGLTAGLYSVTVSDSAGCASTADTTVSEPVALSMTLTMTAVSCNGSGDGTATALVSGGTTPYSYLWDDPLAQTTNIASGLGAGVFTAAITDNNGCTGNASVSITEPPQLSLTMSSTDNCEGQAEGTATVIAGGGTGTLTYLWDDANAQTATAASGLTAGTYTVTVQDGNGCTDTGSVVVNSLALPVISAGADVTIALGASVQLNATGGLFYNWTPSTGLSCMSCPGPVASPVVTTDYTVVGTDANNCLGADTVTVFVDDKITLYLSDIFSPNGDGENDYIFVQGLGIERVEEFIIYDRWGEKVFENSDFVANDMNQGWDGKFKGTLMNPAVFVFYVKVQFVDGTGLEEKGNITLAH